MCVSGSQECINNPSCACLSSAFIFIFITWWVLRVLTPLWDVKSSSFSRSTLHPSISHLSGVSHTNDQTFHSEEERALQNLFWVSQSNIRWWWSNETFASYITICSLLAAVFCSDTLSLPPLFSSGLHRDPVLEACTTQMRTSALSTMTWSQRRAAVWPRNPLRYPTRR